MLSWYARQRIRRLWRRSIIAAADLTWLLAPVALTMFIVRAAR